MQASGQRQRDEAQLDNARLILERDRTLLAQDSIARQDVDTQAALVKQLEGTVITDRASEGSARLNLGYTRVVSPINGRVGLRTVDVGNLVNANDANGIAVVTQLAPIDVVFAVPQDQVPAVQSRLAEGAVLPAIALDRTRAATLDTGKFMALDNQVDVQTGTVRSKARFANAKNTLFPSQFVNVRLELRTIKDAVVVPVTALRHGSSGDFVYVLNGAERTVALRPVTRGQATVDKIELTSGVKAGEQVITEGADRLKDGAKVVLPGDKPAMGGGRGEGRGEGKRGHRGANAEAGTAASGSASGGASASAPGEPGQGRRHKGSAP
jgi:multidrug efflux system membrane fusion protein